MHKQPTLYKRAKTGAIVYYKIWVQEWEDHSVINKESGQLWTQSPVVHSERIDQGKNLGKVNETTPLQQALSQMTSDWAKKRDEGYKSLSDLKIIIVGPNDEDMVKHYNEKAYVDYRDNLTRLLDEALPQFNTDASGNVKPMLAPSKPWVEGKVKNYPQLLETKFDGLRSTIIAQTKQADNGWHHRVQILSRSGKPYDTVNHIKTALLTWMIANPEERNIILDGELYVHGWTLQEINRAVKKVRPGITEQMQFWMFDLPLHGGDQLERGQAAEKLVGQIANPLIKFSKPIWVDSDEDVLRLHDAWVADGYEGGMLKYPQGVYEPGCRSNFWKKVKMFEDTEFEIVGHVLGQRGVEDLMFVCKSPGGNFEVKVSGSRHSKQELFDEYVTSGKYIGMKYTVKHFGYTEDNIPNIPTGRSLRED